MSLAGGVAECFAWGVGAGAGFGLGVGLGLGAGVAAGDFVGWLSCLAFFSTEDLLAFLEMLAKEIEVNKKMIATTVVSLLKKVAAPRDPKTVWEAPPKAAPISAPFPAWSRITMIKKVQTV